MKTILALFSILLIAPAGRCAVTAQTSSGITVSVDRDGSYSIETRKPRWTFGGHVGVPLSSITTATGRDGIGRYREITFQYSDETARTGSIRAYFDTPVVLFTAQYDAASPNRRPFPELDQYPRSLSTLSYHSTFSHPAFDLSGPDSPWLFFDEHANAFLLSPASHFLQAVTTTTASGAIAAGIAPEITTLPAGFTQRTILAVEPGINAAFDAWGRALTALYKKKLPAADSEPILRSFGYWTDAGADYYYATDSSSTYEQTLLAVKDDFAKHGIPLGYLQLDSWWYPKGNPPAWDDRLHGQRTYEADPVLFPDGLKGFEAKLGLPLVTHSRWIDQSSPYHGQYAMSGTVVTDPKFWADRASYLKEGGVAVYEQDWLSNENGDTRMAAADLNLTDPDAFLDNMAAAMADKGLTIQYCMARPRDFLQSVKYPDVTNIRVTGDRFERSKWDQYLYTSRMASALGLWPWSDVFMSGETRNLLLSDLSGGPVGVGDALGKVNAENVRRVARADGTLVKPDAPIVPLDASYVAEARASSATMVAWAYSDHEGGRTAYVFAYARPAVAPSDQTPYLESIKTEHASAYARDLSSLTAEAAFVPSSLVPPGPAYVYNYFAGTGRLVSRGERFSDSVDGNGSYYIVAPVGPSGIAFIGDADKFAAMGRQRVAKYEDEGRVRVTVDFSKGETGVTLRGYAASAPRVVASEGSAGAVAYDPSARLFAFTVSPGSAGRAVAVVTSR